MTKSALAKHVHFQEDMHEINWKSVQIINHVKRRQQRKIREALEIAKKKSQMNRDKGMEISNTWTVLILYIFLDKLDCGHIIHVRNMTTLP